MPNIQPGGTPGTPWFDYPITHGYITDYQGPNTDTPHYAYDLGTPFHTPLTAPLAGTVKIADYQGWGGEVFVQPDDKTLPEYYMYHLDDEMVHAGQHVNAGDELGLSGGQTSGGDHPTQAQWSTGPHTHVGWFTKYTTTPAGGRPYGPEPADLIQAAKTGFDPNLLGFNGNTPAPAPTGIDAIGAFLNGVPAQMGGLLLRTGVGLVGALLIGVGVYEVVYALKDQAGSNPVVQSIAKPVEAAKDTAVKAAKLAVL